MGNLSDIGRRLAEERAAREMTQTQAADIAGVTRKTVFGYESGQRAPDGAALAAWAGAGFDVLYILTGQRASNVSPAKHLPAPNHSRSNDLTPAHRALLDNYEHCAPEDQAAIRRLASTAAQPTKPVTKRPRKAG